jgi:alpha-L-fucosidase
MNIMDFANDDRFNTAWIPHSSVENPWLEITLGENEQPFNMVVITEKEGQNRIKKYRIEYFLNNKWQTILTNSNPGRVKIHRFDKIWGNRVKITIEEFSETPGIAEFGVYNERQGSE